MAPVQLHLLLHNRFILPKYHKWKVLHSISINLDPHLKSLFVFHSQVFFLSQRSATNCGVNSVWHQNSFNNFLKVFILFNEPWTKNKMERYCIFLSFIPFDFKVSFCLSCIIDKIGFLLSSNINSNSCFKYTFAKE